jgi:hypothetical protein
MPVVGPSTETDQQTRWAIADESVWTRRPTDAFVEEPTEKLIDIKVSGEMAFIVVVVVVAGVVVVVEITLGIVVVVLEVLVFGPIPAGVALPVAMGDEEDLELSN